MCGLVGVIGDINFQDAKVFQQLLFVDTLRGSHSTGVATNDANNEVVTYKRAVSAPDYLQLKQGSAIAGNIYGDFLLGHNRYATQGAVNDINAHPFTYGNVTLAHNGTLGDQSTLPDHKEFKVDSENIAYAMGLTDNPEEVISVLKGAFALTWYNDNKMEFYIVRNQERPMWIAKHKTRDTFYYASEKYMLKAILTRNDIDYTIEELPVGMLATFNLEDTTGLKPSFRKVKIQPKYVKPTTVYYNNWNQNKWSNDVKKTPGHPLNKLKDYGLKTGDEVEFYSEGIPTGSKQTTPMGGITTDGQNLEIKCFQAPVPAVAGYYTGIVQSMVKTGNTYELILTTPWLQEIIAEDVNNLDKKDEVEEILQSQKDVYLLTDDDFCMETIQ